MNPLALYHVTDKRNRGAIRRYGLLPRDTGEHNYPGLDCQPTGVFGTEPDWRPFHHLRSPVGSERDVWRLDILGLPVVKDNLVRAWVVTCTVPPERLTLVKTLHSPNGYDWEGGWPASDRTDMTLGAADFANFREYSQGQYANVYFSMVGSYADQFTYSYYGRRYTYVVEPLGPVERDPEDETGWRRGPSGSMRCERAVIREKHRTDAWEPVRLAAS